MTTVTAQLTRPEAAYAHLASFQRGDQVDVGGRAFFQPGRVIYPQQPARSTEEAYLMVEGCGIQTHVTVTGEFTITSRTDAAAGEVRYFDTVGYAMQNPEG